MAVTPNFGLELFSPLGVGWREDATAGALLDYNMMLIDAAIAHATGAVSSVNGHTGAVSLSYSDVNADAAGAAATAQSNAQTYAQSVNTSGTAANLSGTPALPNGTTATTQTVGDSSAKLATDAFVIAEVSFLESFISASYIPLSVLSAHGDMIYENASLGPVRLPIGSTGQVLSVTGGQPAWSTPSITPPGGSSADIQYNNGSGGFAGSAATITSGGSITLPSGQALDWSTDTSISRASANVIQIGNTGGTPDASGTLELANLNMMDGASGATPVLNLTAGGVSGNDPYLTVSGSDGGSGQSVLFRIMNTYVGEVSFSNIDMCCYNDTTKGGTLIGGNYANTTYGLVPGFSIRAKANTPDICISTGAFTGGNLNVGVHLMMQDTTGRIGIGTFAAPNFSPQATLDVTGNIRTDQLQLGTSADTSISRASADVIQIGNTSGTPDASGTLDLKKIVLTDFGSTPTSSSGGGTAGTVGEIVQHSGLLYFCSVTGVAGSATWNVITMTQLP